MVCSLLCCYLSCTMLCTWWLVWWYLGRQHRVSYAWLNACQHACTGLCIWLFMLYMPNGSCTWQCFPEGNPL